MFAPRSSRRVPSRRCCRDDWTYFRRITLCVAFFARYMAFCAGIGQTSYASFALQPESNRLELNWAAQVVRSSKEAPFIPLQISWQPNPCSLRVVLDASRRVAIVVRTERTFVGSLVAWRSLRDTWRSVQGLAKYLASAHQPIISPLGISSFFSHCKSLRYDLNVMRIPFSSLC
jgi:hypothetical protein